MRGPSATVVVDAATLIAAVLGRSFGAVFEAGRTLRLLTTDRVAAEAARRIELGMKRPELLGVLEVLLDAIAITPVDRLNPLLRLAEFTLQHAVPSRNGSTRDAHVLALAWEVDGDIWTTDRDFAGTGVATWSTPNLMRALAAVDIRTP